MRLVAEYLGSRMVLDLGEGPVSKEALLGAFRQLEFPEEIGSPKESDAFFIQANDPALGRINVSDFTTIAPNTALHFVPGKCSCLVHGLSISICSVATVKYLLLHSITSATPIRKRQCTT